MAALTCAPRTQRHPLHKETHTAAHEDITPSYVTVTEPLLSEVSTAAKRSMRRRRPDRCSETGNECRRTAVSSPVILETVSLRFNFQIVLLAAPTINNYTKLSGCSRLTRKSGLFHLRAAPAHRAAGGGTAEEDGSRKTRLQPDGSGKVLFTAMLIAADQAALQNTGPDVKVLFSFGFVPLRGFPPGSLAMINHCRETLCRTALD